jgi:hypothetical protein
VIEAVQAFARRMSRLIRNLKPSRWYGRDRSGTGISCGAARRVADDTGEAGSEAARAGSERRIVPQWCGSGTGVVRYGVGSVGTARRRE